MPRWLNGCGLPFGCVRCGGAAERRPGGCLLPQGACPAGMHPPFSFPSCGKENGPCTVQKKRPLWSQLCTCVQSCCARVGVRGCLRVCEDCPTGAAGYGTGLIVGSRGAVHLKSGCKDAFDQLLFPRVPLRYALPGYSQKLLPCPMLQLSSTTGQRQRKSAQGVSFYLPGLEVSPRAGRFRP